MKIRNGFVSNSSSSSFVCVITGDSRELYSDVMYIAQGVAICENGHQFDVAGWDKVEEYVRSKIEELAGDDDDYCDEDPRVPAELCPVCNGEAKPLIIQRIIDIMDECNITKEDIIIHED